MGLLGCPHDSVKQCWFKMLLRINIILTVPGANPRAELSIPLMVGEKLLGVLDLASSRPFTLEDTKAAQIIADQLAVAIEHAYLFR